MAGREDFLLEIESYNGHPPKLLAGVNYIRAKLRANCMLFAAKSVPNSCLCRPKARHRQHHRIVGIENCAPSLMPEGQRAVTVLVLV